jgi:hypothetical protein
MVLILSRKLAAIIMAKRRLRAGRRNRTRFPFMLQRSPAAGQKSREKVTIWRWGR